MDAIKTGYARDGFAVLNGVVSASLAETIRSDLHTLVNLQLKAAGGTPRGDLVDDMEALLQLDVSRYLAAVRRGAKLMSVNRLLTNPLLDSAAKAIGLELVTVCGEPVLHVVSDRLVIPGGYQGFKAHQDWTSIQGSLDSIVVWAPLVPITAQNFPLQVVPGTHRLGLLPGEITEHVMVVPEEDVPGDSYIPVEVNPGDVAFMSGWTAHRTGILNCSGFRLACSIRYDNAAEPTFVDRQYPCAYQRSVHRELFTPDFPSISQVEHMFDRLVGA